MNHRHQTVRMGVVLWLLAVASVAEPAPPAAEADGVPPFTVTETEIQLPGVTIDRATREVRVGATACLESGILEYVVCRPDTFEHESIFTTEAQPEMVHAALLLAGLKPTPMLRGMIELWWEKARARDESRVKIEVEWEEDGVRKRVPLASLLRSREADGAAARAPVEDTWIFAGSFVRAHPQTGARVYAANQTGILVGIWPDPSTVIQYGVPSGNPYEGKDLGMEIEEERVPEEGTKVQLVLSRAGVRNPEAGAGEKR